MVDDPDGAATPASESEHEESPIGAMVLALGFLGLIIVVWLWTYAELLGRS